MSQITSTINLDTVSGICGTVSIACWIVVFTPQIIENFRRKSADGLSVIFVIIWLLGDVFNVVGSVLQKVLPTMVILAVWYLLADVVLLGQVWWYRGFVFKDEPAKPADVCSISSGEEEEQASEKKKMWWRLLLNFGAVVLVCAAGVLGWWLSILIASRRHHNQQPEDLRGQLPQFDISGQVFGYLCAALYLGSRIPQLLLNYRRKSTDGVSLLFFAFACIGQITYVMSIVAFNPAPRCEGGASQCVIGEQRRIYARYIAVNASWIGGNLGESMLDLMIFAQAYMYRKSCGRVDGKDEGREAQLC